VIIGIILASGQGKRIGDLKQFTKLAGLPVIVHTLKTFQQHKLIEGIVVVTLENKIELVWNYVRQYSLNKVIKVVAGGKTRQESSFIGLSCCPDNTKYVLIHDAVRPFVTSKIIDDLSEAVKKYKAVDTAIPSADTIIQVNENNFITNIPDRSFLRRGQTPQAFEYNLILEAHKQALKDGIEDSTDDCRLVLSLGHPVYVVSGHEQNIKITYPIDLHIADKLFQLRTIQSEIKDYSKLLENKVVVVIGGTSGIGFSTVELLKTIKTIPISLSRRTKTSINITKLGSIQRALGQVASEYGRIDAIVNCAGDLIKKDVEFMNEKDWDYIYNVNVKGCFLLAKAALPIFKKQGYGNIVFVGSSSYTRGRAGYSAYSSAKAALVNFVQALAEEVERVNIKVNVVSPGRVNTPLRFRNFGKEDPNTLLNPEVVAEQIIKALVSETTGSVFEIR